jgi:YbbR domain-containing protein
MVLSIEDKVTAQLPLIVETTGQVADGYALGNCTATPNLITVEGPRSVVDKVTEIRAVVDVSMRFESFSVEVEPVCYDVYGESMSGKQLSLDVESVKVSVPVYPTKEVSLQVETSGKVEDGYEITAINYHPQTIVIAAEEADLKAISAIHINNISVTGQTESMEVNLDIEDYLPANVYLADSNQQVAVSITIEKLEERRFALQTTDVELQNQNEAYDYELVIPENYNVHITGLKADIEEVTIANVAPSIDCSNLEIGTYDVELTLKDGSKYTASNDGTLQLIVSEKEEIQEDTTDGEGDTEAE